MKRLKLVALIVVLVLLAAGCTVFNTNPTALNTSAGSASTIRVGNEAAPLGPLSGHELPGDRDRFDSYVYSVEKLKANYKPSLHKVKIYIS